MAKFTWILDEIENTVIVTRVVDTGEEDEAQQPILKMSRVSRDDAFMGINEIRSSLDMLERELKTSAKEEEAPKKKRAPKTPKMDAKPKTKKTKKIDTQNS